MGKEWGIRSDPFTKTRSSLVNKKTQGFFLNKKVCFISPEFTSASAETVLLCRGYRGRKPYRGVGAAALYAPERA